MLLRRKRLWQVLLGTAFGVMLLGIVYLGLVVLACAGVIPVTHIPAHATTEFDDYTVDVEIVGTHPMLSEHDMVVTVRKRDNVLAVRKYSDSGGHASVYLLREGDDVIVVSSFREGVVVNPSRGTIREMDFHEVPDDWSDAAFGRFAFLHRDGKTKYQWVPKEEYPAHWHVKGTKPEAALIPQSKWTAEALTGQAAKNPHDPTRGANLEVVGVTVAPTDPTYGPKPAFVELAGHSTPGADQRPTVVCMPYWSHRGAFRNIPVGHRVRVVGQVAELKAGLLTHLAYCTAIDLGPASGE